MPVEIKELLIRVSVEDSQSNPAGPTTNHHRPQNGSNRGAEGKDKLLKACLEQTVELLQQKKER